MSKLSDPHLLLTSQYKNASNLDTRIHFHDRFSTNKYGWHRWIFDQVRCPPKSKILELGCGTGLLWAKNRDRIPAEWDLILSDFSPGMLREAQNEMRGVHQRMDFMQIDAQFIPFKDRTFDVIIANSMLYHVPDLERALSEIHRVLRNPGILYAATGGKTDGLGLKDWVKKAQPSIGDKTKDIEVDQSFSIENGASALAPWFTKITLHRYQDSLEITEVDPLVDYVQSTISMRLDERNLPEFRRIVTEEIDLHGAIHIAKSGGIFEARKRKPAAR